MARFVITGGAGFIGSHLCDRLLSEGNEVVAVDNLITGSVNNLNLARLITLCTSLLLLLLLITLNFQ